MEQPWQIYYDEFERRAGRASDQRFGRDEALKEAAHGAYRATADRLSREANWDDDRTLVVTHAFGETVKRWIDRGVLDWDGLRHDLRARWEKWIRPVADTDAGRSGPGRD